MPCTVAAERKAAARVAALEDDLALLELTLNEARNALSGMRAYRVKMQRAADAAQAALQAAVAEVASADQRCAALQAQVAARRADLAGARATHARLQQRSSPPSFLPVLA